VEEGRVSSGFWRTYSAKLLMPSLDSGGRRVCADSVFVTVSSRSQNSIFFFLPPPNSSTTEERGQGARGVDQWGQGIERHLGCFYRASSSLPARQGIELPIDTPEFRRERMCTSTSGMPIETHDRRLQSINQSRNTRPTAAINQSGANSGSPPVWIQEGGEYEDVGFLYGMDSGI
jgi:hypothetical protein